MRQASFCASWCMGCQSSTSLAERASHSRGCRCPFMDTASPKLDVLMPSHLTTPLATWHKMHLIEIRTRPHDNTNPFPAWMCANMRVTQSQMWFVTWLLIRTGWYLSPPPPRQCVYWPFALPWWYFNTYVKYWRFRNLIDATNQLFHAHSGRIEWWVEFTSASRHTRTHLFAGPMHTSTTLNVSSLLSCWLENALWDETLSPVLFIYQTPGSSHKSDTH